MTQPFGQRVLAGLGPAFTEAAGALLPDIIDALTDELADTDALLTVPAGPHTAAPLADLATSPYPRWLGQLAGLVLPAGLTLADARRYIAGRSVSRRGTPLAIKTAVGDKLTGTRRVDLVERDGSPWQLRIITYSAETPDPAAALEAAVGEKPVGIVLTQQVRIGQTLGQLAATSHTLGSLTALTYDQIRRTVPSV